MTDRSRALGLRRPLFAAALALATLGAAVPWGGSPLGAEASAASRRGPQKIDGTWELSWQNSRGETRKGQLLVEQRGSQLTARLLDRHNATATGTVAGSSFTLHGTRFGLPFTIAGRVADKRMTGALTALGVERRFTGTRRR